MERLTFILLLLFLLGEAPAFAKDLWNIDCGGTATFVNANNLTFEGDAPYIHTGVSRAVPNAERNSLRREFSTLRAFPREPWKKSCYRVPVEPGTKVLVRTNFYYGNYDGLNSPPEFEVGFDTAERCSVATDSDLESWMYCEVVYLTTKKQGTDICFVRTNDDQSPIVSSIEVRRLPSDMYRLLDFFSYALFNRRRFAFGANGTIGYPNDAYNRDWEPNDLQGIEGDGVYVPVIVKTENATAVDTSGIDDSPPALLFHAAAVAPMISNQTAANLTIRTPWLPIDATNIYLTMYFTEPIASNSTSEQDKRVFNVYKDGEQFSNTSDPMQPSYGFVTEFSASMYEASNETTFDLVPADGSTLPPAISGMEVYLIYDTANATDSNDVEGLSTLQSSFTLLEKWTGDPCVPTGYNWEWLGCKYPDASPPRITKLLLRGYQLSGNIPDFSSLDALEYIDLSNNSFTGSVPVFLASLPNLRTLNLSRNDFDGIPLSLRDNKKINLIIKDNPKLTSPPKPLGETPAPAPTSACNKVHSSKLVVFILLLATTVVL